MGFLDKFKVTGQGDAAARGDTGTYSDDIALDDDFIQGKDEKTIALPAAGAAAAEPVQADSIITEAAPTELPSEFTESRIAGEGAGVAAAAAGGLPLIGHLPPERQQRVLSMMLLGGVVLLLLAAFWSVREAGRSSAQVGAVGQALMQSQRLAKAVSQALVGSETALVQTREAVEALGRNTRALASGDAELGVPALPGNLEGQVQPVQDLVARAEKNTKIVLDQEKVLTKVGSALRAINRQSADLLEIAETISSLKLQQEASSAELAASGQLVMLTQRIGKSANEFLTVEGVSPEAVFLLGKDLNTFREIAQGLLDGNADLRLPASRDPQVRERLQALLKTFDETRQQATAILGNLQGLVAAREAEVAVVNDSEPLRKTLEELQAAVSGRTGSAGRNVLLFGLPLLLAGLGGFGWLAAWRQDQAQRVAVSDRQRGEAERQEREAKRVNDANQAAILRLMNELQSVAEGDLTQQATVTEDITGAIADSVNYTVEELRSLVSQVQTTAARVTETTQQVEATSTELLAASDEQLREIRETGESVLQMAGRINRVSAQAQESANVARQSLAAAEQGLSAVQETIGGMNAIREQIQETSKRIKRLGESSQEIGEITELISDITEQTNVLALNAAIQAASAGEAGRGFSVVAEEVQRLAERSADATRQISALVKTIQTDTADAVAAMERSTQGVVEGAKLSDNAGAALADIDRVSRSLADLIQQISSQARQEADSANVVASNIQHIFAVTEQTGDGTRSTAQLVRELSRSAEELKQSVARFKVA